MLTDGRRSKIAPKHRNSPHGERRSGSAAASADAGLIRMCREFNALERRIVAATVNISNIAGRDKVTTPLYRRQDMLLDNICKVMPQTLPGCQAIAASLDLWTSPGKTGSARDLLEVLLTGLAKLKA